MKIPKQTESRIPNQVLACGKRLVSKKVKSLACRVHSLTRTSGNPHQLAVTAEQYPQAHNPRQQSHKILKQHRTQTLHLSLQIAKPRGHPTSYLSATRRPQLPLIHSRGHRLRKSLTTLLLRRLQSSTSAVDMILFNQWSLEEHLLAMRACLHHRLHLRWQHPHRLRGWTIYLRMVACHT